MVKKSDNLCMWLMCLGVLATLGLSIAIYMKLSPKKEGFVGECKNYNDCVKNCPKDTPIEICKIMCTACPDAPKPARKTCGDQPNYDACVSSCSSISPYPKDVCEKVCKLNCPPDPLQPPPPPKKNCGGQPNYNACVSNCSKYTPKEECELLCKYDCPPN